ncbi:MAG: HD domain-containing protein [Gemmataceae bacterium]
MSGSPTEKLGVDTLVPLLGEINDLKRVYVAGDLTSLASRGFLRAWQTFRKGEPPDSILWREVTQAVAGARLAGINTEVMTRGGLSVAAQRQVYRRTIEELRPHLHPTTFANLLDGIDLLLQPEAHGEEAPPAFALRLAGQPRAGATRPGHPRLILEPPENHADHCYIVAVTSVLVAPFFDATPELPFLAGLSHHLHNAFMPDAGFTGEELLGEHLEGMMEAFTSEALQELHPALQSEIQDARKLLTHADIPEAKAFHAADVLDRVLQMVQYERVANFTLGQALEDLDLVHPGPLQKFQNEVLAEAQLWGAK